mgnify:CR=1 FL=1
MSFLSPPKTSYTDHYDLTRFNLVWNLCLVLVVLLSFVSIANISNNNYSSTANLIEVSIGLIALFVLWKKRRFEFVCIFASVGSFILISITYFTITDTLHYTTPMWGVLEVLFTFFMLGRIWGLIILIGHIVVLMFYYTFRLEANIESLPTFTDQTILNLIIETCIISFAIGYLLSKFIKTNQHAELTVKKANQELTYQNQIISAQNEEKEVMLKEIHHRVKNNLQVITSLLRLQSYELEGEKEINSFTEAINRVKSMALIHEKMYKSEMLANFDLKNYLESLINELIDTYAVKKPIHLDVRSDINNIGSKSIVPISLLFNELISNSIKHAFENQEYGEIFVRVNQCERGDYFCLKYQDNGLWKENTKKSFGLELIDTMTEQLEGEYELETSKDGTTYSFTLKVMIE